MSGNYFAVGYDNPSIISDPSEQYYYGRWGIQRRFLGYGLIDIGINFGYSTYRKYNEFTDYSFSRDALFIQSTAQVGLGLVFGNEKALDKERLCSVIKCYTRETFLLKINTTNLFSVYHSTTEHQNEYRLSPKIAIEQKLFNLPVSIGTDFGLDYTYWTSNKENPYSRDYNLSVYTGRIQARYYYNLKNWIRTGKCGDGLSANYISGGYYKKYVGFKDSKIIPQDGGYTISTGIQRTFSDHFYFDVEMGFQNGIYPYNFNVDYNYFADIQVGIKF